jgi:hypothetical protein
MIATEKLALAAGLDAGNRSMRKAGRTSWDVSDWDVATAEYMRVRATIPPEVKPAEAARPDPVRHQSPYGHTYKDGE